MKFVWNSGLCVPDTCFISLTKPKALIESSVDLRKDELILAGSANPTQLMLAHAPAYVARVLSRRERNGFGTNDTGTLDHVLAANGVMIRAAAEALKTPGHPVIAPVSGFHHAGYSSNWGFCTFNGLLIAAAAAGKIHGVADRVLIIDGDGHYADGTDDIIARCPERFSGVMNLTRMSRRTWYNDILAAIGGGPWDLILYQAGADAHNGDSYGVGYLSDEAWEERDTLVFGMAAERAIPIVVNLGGGYMGERTLDLHRSTFASARVGSAQARRSAAHYSAARAVLEPREQAAARSLPGERVVNESRAP